MSWSERDIGFCLFFVVETIGLVMLLGASSVAVRILGGVIVAAAWLPVIVMAIGPVKDRDRASDPRRDSEHDHESGG